jgi:hypothetical protein
MISLQFLLKNPFNETFKNICSKAGSITKNKHWEFECYRSNAIIAFCLDVRTRCDHAGIRVELSLLGYTIGGNIYDSRHWNYETSKWEVHE